MYAYRFVPSKRLPFAACLGILSLALFLAHTFFSPAFADVLGRLQITTIQEADGKPVPHVLITLHDSAGVVGDQKIETDENGVVLTAPLFSRAWTLTTEQLPGLYGDTRTVTVVSDTTTNITISLQTRIRQVAGVTHIIPNAGSRAASDTRRDATFVSKFPANGGNPQNLGRVLSTVPGFVPSSVNAVHPRGEHALTSIYVDGFLLGGVNQGRAAPFISPDIIQSMDVITGGFAPEYGSETAAVLNLTLKAGPIVPFQSFEAGSGGYKTNDGILSIGGQAGQALESSDNGPVPR